ncbi:PepSY1/2 domain-containing protein [Alicyclobacillus ferrooxydans]|uniref:PepSY domain-containing protein n=1 Tax=Alicyclobacillus ferrooxydans TaxID=471514 RepID=A0A0N8PP76_9BACL|nr:PepSY1/2 domain-containing protein [Alicyclobacillus ferrooxydans]KPV43549.1 hypothetical protein AN477_12175 [Alicyclobacillus ferrooxydans]
MHRITWFAIPIVGLAVLSSGLGVWNYRLHNDRQALVAQTDAQYSSAFHSLVSDVGNIEKRLGESEVSADKAGFAACSRDIWRISFAAQNEIAKLPVELMPMHNTQAFLTALSNQSDAWLNEGATSKDPTVLKQVETYYKKAEQASTELEDVQNKILNGGLGWVGINRAMNQKNGYHTGDNQVVDGFRNLDNGLSGFSEAAALGGQVEGPASPGKTQQGPIVSPSAAMQRVAALLNVQSGKDWRTKTSNLGGVEQVYMISGSTSHGPMSAVVTRAGGKVLVLHGSRTVRSSQLGLAGAADKAESWLQKNGFGEVTTEIANEYDHVAYFVLVPKTKNGLAIDSPISVHVALDNGDILALDTQAYYRTPIPQVAPKRVYTADELRNRLNKQLNVEQVRNVVMHDNMGSVRSGVQFIGTHGGQTYSVVMDATTGKQISVRQLS